MSPRLSIIIAAYNEASAGFRLATRAAIIGLFDGSSPSAIFGRIWTIIVDSVNTVLWGWSRPHVAVERSETFPCAADRNPSAAVVRVRRVAHGVASLTHADPDGVLGHTAMQSVFTIDSRSDHIAERAPARCGVAVTQVLPVHPCFIAANAQTVPYEFVAGCSARFVSQDSQSSKCSSGQCDTLHGYSEPPIPDAVTLGVGALRVTFIVASRDGHASS